MSKEEIEQAKERIQNSLNNICFATLYSQEQNDEDEKTLLQYIDQLEEYLERISKQLDNVAIDQIPIAIKELQEENNKQNKIIDEMVKQLTTLALWDNQNEKVILLKTKQDIKQYFERNAKIT